MEIKSINPENARHHLKVILLHLCLVFLLIMLSASYSMAQKKPASKSPSQSEMSKMMGEMDKMLKEMEGEMSEEDKRMMDSLGIKMPDMKKASKSMSGVSDKQLAAAWEDETRIVPKKNTTRIAAIPNVSKQAMSAYLKAAHAEVIKALPASVVDYAEKVYAFCVQSNISAERMSTVSAGFWMEGKTGVAVYLLGKALTQTNEAEVRGNYAALLSMMDAPHIAIPVLNVLNAEFPKNSTLLNNLGQAWFGLGELVKAEKYLDSAIAIYPYHPQANLTKARIEESKGNPKKAVECVKRSIKHAYTKEKEETLKRLGYKITMNDLSYHFKADTDPLSIGKFKRPEYPRNAQELKALAPIWQEFNDELTMEIAKLEKEKRDQSQKVNENTQQMVAQAMKLVQNGGTVPAFMRPPLYATKAGLALEQLKKYEEAVQKRLVEKFKELKADLDKIEKERRIVQPEDPCYVHRDAFNDYLNKYNTRKKAYDELWIEARKRYHNEIAYWTQYTSTDEVMYELLRIDFRIAWLKDLRENLNQPLLKGPLFEDCTDEEKGKQRGKLQDFAKTSACKYRSVMKLGPLKIKSNCNQMSTEFDFMFLKVTREDDFDRAEGDNFVSSTVRVSAEVGKDISYWPLKAEAKLGGGVEVAIGKNGVEDVILVAEAKLGAGTNVFDDYEAKEGSGEPGTPGIGLGGKDPFPTTIEAGVEGRVSIISGHGSLTGSGVLGGIELAKW